MYLDLEGFFVYLGPLIPGNNDPNLPEGSGPNPPNGPNLDPQDPNHLLADNSSRNTEENQANGDNTNGTNANGNNTNGDNNGNNSNGNHTHVADDNSQLDASRPRHELLEVFTDTRNGEDLYEWDYGRIHERIHNQAGVTYTQEQENAVYEEISDEVVAEGIQRNVDPGRIEESVNWLYDYKDEVDTSWCDKCNPSESESGLPSHHNGGNDGNGASGASGTNGTNGTNNTSGEVAPGTETNGSNNNETNSNNNETNSNNTENNGRDPRIISKGLK